MSYDLHIRLLDPAQQAPGRNLALGMGRPIRVDGLQKLANHWLKTFLTPKGSNPRNLLEGTNFTYLLADNAQDPDSAQTALLEYIEDATEQVKRAQRLRRTVPASEILRAASLLQFTQVSPTTFDIWVTVTNAEGGRLPVLIPYLRLI